MIRFHLYHRYDKLATAERKFILLIYSTIGLCISDIISGAFRGTNFPISTILLEITNCIYYEFLVIIAYLWLVYVLIKSRRVNNKLLFYSSIPLIIFTIIAIINPFTHFLFVIDEKNIYHRSNGIYLHWAILWGYLIASTAIVCFYYRYEKKFLKKKDLLSLVYFIIPPFIASVIQMCFYGITTSQCGIAISIVIISLLEINGKVIADSLTGLFNRNGLNNYLSRHFAHHSGEEMTVVILDVDRFKEINDYYGHLAGDETLKNIASILKKACSDVDNKLFLCRYGGDEFIIVNYDNNASNQDLLTKLRNHIDELLMIDNNKKNIYQLSLSMGSECKICNNFKDFEELVHLADKKMYEEKRRRKSQ